MLQKKEQLELERQILEKTDLLIETLIETSMLVGAEQEKKLEDSVAIVFDMAVLLEDYLGGHPEHFETLLRELTRQKLPDENVLKSFGDFNTYLDSAILKGLEQYRNSDIEDSGTDEPEEDPVEVLSEEIGEEQVVETVDATNPPELAAVAVNEEQEESVVSLDATASTVTTVAGEENEEVKEETGEEEISLAPDEREDVIVSEDELELSSPEPDSHDVEMIDEIQEQASFSQELIPPEDKETGDVQNYWDLALKQVFPDTSIAKDYNHKGITFSYFLPERAIAIDLSPGDKRQAVWKEYYCKQEQIKLLSIPALDNPRPRQIIRTLKLSLAQNAGQFS